MDTKNLTFPKANMAESRKELAIQDIRQDDNRQHCVNKSQSHLERGHRNRVLAQHEKGAHKMRDGTG